MAYDRMNMIGPERFDYLAAKICQTIANFSGFRSKDSPVHTLLDFLVDFDVTKPRPKPEEKVQPLDAMLGFVEAMNARMGGKDLR